MKLAVVGSRTFNDYNLLKESIDNLINEKKIKIDALVSGGAKGADSLGAQYGQENNIPLIEFKPDWKKYGKSAGFKRNIDIINECDMCIAFWDGESHGTKHDIDLCEKSGKECVVVKF